jgi:hypothetical protein
MNRGHAEPLSGSQALDHDATRIQPLTAGVAGAFVMKRSRTSGRRSCRPDASWGKNCDMSLTFRVPDVCPKDHVYWQKSTSRKSAFDKEIGKAPEMRIVR